MTTIGALGRENEETEATLVRFAKIAAWLCILFFSGIVVTYGYGRDQGIYAVVGRTILEGGMPYRDAWDFKPPGIFLLYALSQSLFGTSETSIRILEAITLLLTAVYLQALANRWFKAPLIGLFAATINALVHAELDFWHTAQPESFGAFLVVAALYYGSDASHKNRLPKACAAGLLSGMAALLKPPLGGVVLVIGLLLLLRDRRTAGRRPTVLALATMCVGALAPIGITIAWFSWRGALPDLVEVLFRFTPHYTKLSWEGASILGMSYYALTEWFATYSSLTTIGLSFLMIFGIKPEERVPAAMLLGVIALQLIGIAMQGKFFPYHYGGIWPVSCLLAALGYAKLYRFLAAGAPRVGPVFFLVTVLVSARARSATKDVSDSFATRVAKRLALFTASGPDRERTRDALASVADVNAAANRLVASYLTREVPHDQSVFIWGFEPTIYAQIDRRPSSKYIYNVPQRTAWAKAETRAQLMSDLYRAQPGAIVIEHRDVFPMVTGDYLDSADTLPDFPTLVEFIRSRYRLASQIEDFDIYLPAPPSPLSTP